MASNNSSSNDKHKSYINKDYDKALDERVRDKLLQARISLLLKAPFFGNIAIRLQLTWADNWLGTAATDGRHFYYNSRFVDALPDKEVEFLVGHEVLHNVFDHFTRRDDRHPKIWNIANDYVVNLILMDENIGKVIKTVDICLDAKYRGQSSEEVYEDLMSKVQWVEVNLNTLDEHIDFSEAGEDDEDGKSKRPQISKEDAKNIRDEVRNAVLQAAKAAGDVPNAVKQLIRDLTEPKINWRDLLRQQIQSTVKSDYSFQRPNRKAWHTGAVLPGMINDQTIDICLSIDTSGSVSDEMLRDFLSEVKGIMDEYKDFKLTLWHFSCSIHNPKVFTAQNIDEIYEYEIQERGGTDFEVNWTWMKEQGIEPKRFVVMTDGYPCGGWGDPDYCDTVWIIHGDATIKPPFGNWAYMDEYINKKH